MATNILPGVINAVPYIILNSKPLNPYYSSQLISMFSLCPFFLPLGLHKIIKCCFFCFVFSLQENLFPLHFRGRPSWDRQEADFCEKPMRVNPTLTQKQDKSEMPLPPGDQQQCVEWLRNRRAEAGCYADNHLGTSQSYRLHVSDTGTTHRHVLGHFLCAILFTLSHQNNKTWTWNKQFETEFMWRNTALVKKGNCLLHITEINYIVMHLIHLIGLFLIILFIPIHLLA